MATLSLMVFAGCGPVAEPCRAGTLAVAVTLAGAATSADELDVSIALDGGTMTSMLTHHAGAAGGNVVVEFPHGYRHGSVAVVSIVARAGGVVVGSGHASATLTGSCQAVMLAVDAIVPDLSASGDLASDASAADLSPPATPDDLSSPTATPDLTTAPPDLLPLPPDMVCPGGGVENCFNGIDDDCDGHVDCDDPDCAPVAVCVPSATGSFTYGTQEPAAGVCPTHTSGGAVYVKDPNGGGCSSSCSCSGNGCSTTFNLTLGCGGGVNTSSTLTSTCELVDEGSSYSWGAINGTLSCAQSGSAAPVTPPTLTSAVSCALSGAPGGGCSNGQVCVARGTKQCVATPSAGAACPTNYPNGTTWYSTLNDGRTCSCSCGAAAAGCHDSSVGVDFYDSKGCDPTTAHSETTPYCSNAYQAVKVTGGCTLSVNQVGIISFSGASTVCCQ